MTTAAPARTDDERHSSAFEASRPPKQEDRNRNGPPLPNAGGAGHTEDGLGDGRGLGLDLRVRDRRDRRGRDGSREARHGGEDLRAHPLDRHPDERPRLVVLGGRRLVAVGPRDPVLVGSRQAVQHGVHNAIHDRGQFFLRHSNNSLCVRLAASGPDHPATPANPGSTNKGQAEPRRLQAPQQECHSLLLLVVAPGANRLNWFSQRAVDANSGPFRRGKRTGDSPQGGMGNYGREGGGSVQRGQFAIWQEYREKCVKAHPSGKPTIAPEG